MVLTNKRYTEPSDVLRALVDDYGNPILLGDQKDIGEFNLNFLERVEEGLGERFLAKKIVEDTKANSEQSNQEKQFEQNLSMNGRESQMRKSSIIDDFDGNTPGGEGSFNETKGGSPNISGETKE